MALVTNTLASALENMTPTATEQPAIVAFSNAWSTYFAGASASGAPAIPGSFDLGITAMQAAMVGFSAPNAGAIGIQNGISAFWTAITPLASSIWVVPAVVLATVTPPTTLGTISAGLLTAFTTNTASNVSLHDAAMAIAMSLQGTGGLGGFAVGESASGAPVTLPIL